MRITGFIVVGFITFAYGYGYFWRSLPLLGIFLAVVERHRPRQQHRQR